MAQLAIIGPGAIGGTLTAWLCQDARHDVVVCARTPVERFEVETPTGTIVATPQMLTDPGAARPVEWVLIATKAYATAGAAAWLRFLLQPNTRVAVLQNGVEHVERFSPYLPAERIVPVVVECPAERLAPGRIRQRGTASLLVPDNPLGKEFIRLFERTSIQASTTSDFRTKAWQKLCLNCAGAVSAILEQPNGVVHFDPIAEIMRGLIRECIAVGRAEGAQLSDDLAETVIVNSRKAARDGVNSLLGDRLAHRPMESDARNGVIVRLGRKHGLPTPFNQMAFALLAAAEQFDAHPIQ